MTAPLDFTKERALISQIEQSLDVKIDADATIDAFTKRLSVQPANVTESIAFCLHVPIRGNVATVDFINANLQDSFQTGTQETIEIAGYRLATNALKCALKQFARSVAVIGKNRAEVRDMDMSGGECTDNVVCLKNKHQLKLCIMLNGL